MPYYLCNAYKTILEPGSQPLREGEEARDVLIKVSEIEGCCIAAFRFGKITLPLETAEKLQGLVGRRVGILRLDGYHVRDLGVRNTPDRSSSTTTRHDPGNERTLSKEDFSGKGQHRTTPHSDHSAKANMALVSNADKKNINCPICGDTMRYYEVRPGSGNLMPACENPNCSATADDLRKRPEPISKETRMKHWQKFGRRC